MQYEETENNNENIKESLNLDDSLQEKDWELLQSFIIEKEQQQPMDQETSNNSSFLENEITNEMISAYIIQCLSNEEYDKIELNDVFIEYSNAMDENLHEISNVIVENLTNSLTIEDYSTQSEICNPNQNQVSVYNLILIKLIKCIYPPINQIWKKGQCYLMKYKLKDTFLWEIWIGIIIGFFVGGAITRNCYNTIIKSQSQEIRGLVSKVSNMRFYL